MTHDLISQIVPGLDSIDNKDLATVWYKKLFKKSLFN